MRGLLPPAEQGEHSKVEDGHRGQEGEEAHPEEDPMDADLHRTGLPHHLCHVGGDDAELYERLPGPGCSSSACKQQYQLIAKPSRPPAAELTIGNVWQQLMRRYRPKLKLKHNIVRVQCL